MIQGGILHFILASMIHSLITHDAANISTPSLPVEDLSEKNEEQDNRIYPISNNPSSDLENQLDDKEIKNSQENIINTFLPEKTNQHDDLSLVHITDPLGKTSTAAQSNRNFKSNHESRRHFPLFGSTTRSYLFADSLFFAMLFRNCDEFCNNINVRCWIDYS